LSAADLTARGLGQALGKTTSVLYHHYGSLDGFLFVVGQSGMQILGERIDAVRRAGGDLADLAAEFVRFGLESPALYALMVERPYDWAALRREGRLGPELPGRSLWELLCDYLRATGAKDPVLDARLLFGGLHGLTSLAASGRANIGALEITDEEAALHAARTLARRLCPQACWRKDHDHHPRHAAPAERPRAAKPSRQIGHERTPGRGRRRPR
jgi:AcrR family transcriptional regulator